MFETLLPDRGFSTKTCRGCGENKIAPGIRAAIYYPPSGLQIYCAGCLFRVESEIIGVASWLREANARDKEFVVQEGEEIDEEMSARVTANSVEMTDMEFGSSFREAYRRLQREAQAIPTTRPPRPPDVTTGTPF